MNDRDSLRERLQASDPYQGEPMPAPDVARIKTRMRASAGDKHARPSWIPVAAAAAVVAVVALGIWAGSRSLPTEESLAWPELATTEGAAPELPSEPVPATDLPPVGELAQLGLVAVQPAPELPASAESSQQGAAPSETAGAADLPLAETTLAVNDAPPAAARRIQFTARRGTRIVWTLDPDFEPSTTRNSAPPARQQQGANGKW